LYYNAGNRREVSLPSAYNYEKWFTYQGATDVGPDGLKLSGLLLLNLHNLQRGLVLIDTLSVAQRAEDVSRIKLGSLDYFPMTSVSIVPSVHQNTYRWRP